MTTVTTEKAGGGGRDAVEWDRTALCLGSAGRAPELSSQEGWLPAGRLPVSPAPRASGEGGGKKEYIKQANNFSNSSSCLLSTLALSD